jgi:hypothetical protein
MSVQPKAHNGNPVKNPGPRQPPGHAMKCILIYI